MLGSCTLQLPAFALVGGGDEKGDERACGGIGIVGAGDGGDTGGCGCCKSTEVVGGGGLV